LSRRVVYRLAVPAEQPTLTGCAICGATFRPGPAGWVSPRRRCPHCQGRFGQPWWPYGLLAATVSGLLAWRLPHAGTADRLLLAAWLLLAPAGAALYAIDVKVHRLPTPIIAVTAATSVPLIAGAALAAHRPAILSTAVLAATAVGLGYLTLAALAPASLGLGDVRLAALLGLLLGSHGWHAVLLGAVLPYPLGAAALAAPLMRRHIHRETAVPFGGPLLAGAITAALIAAPHR
jgi:leader peptidase (prepilin peptidase)/N-methyltransferase